MTYSTHTHTRPGTVRACPDDIRLTIAVRLVSWAACYDFGGPGAADHPATEQPMKRKAASLHQRRRRETSRSRWAEVPMTVADPDLRRPWAEGTGMDRE